MQEGGVRGQDFRASGFSVKGLGLRAHICRTVSNARQVQVDLASQDRKEKEG